MTTLLAVAITIAVPILVALLILILPKALTEKHGLTKAPRRAVRSEVTCVEIPELLETSDREYEVGRRS